MLLVLNTIIDITARNHFDRVVLPRIMSNIDTTYHIVHLGENNPDFDKYSHLLLTGSELSAAINNSCDQQIYQIIKAFLNNNKAILGICHGHQMLAKAITNKPVCRKALKPEFGWIQMDIKPNPLFEGISNPVFLNSHYDEVFDLPSEFIVLTGTSDCKIQAFQYKNKPIWGLQFHPEMLFEDGEPMIENHLQKNPQERVYYHNELNSAEQLQQNLRIFKNFLNYKENI